MWKSKKFILVTLLTAVVLAGSIGGVALAQNGDEGDNQPEAGHTALLSRACEIYQENTGVAIDSAALKDAFAQAQGELQIEAMQSRLQNLVDEGKMTQQQADEYLNWWQSRPEDMPFKFGFGGRGGFHGMGGMRGFGGPCAPPSD
jgi:hypothetical protein